MIFKTIKLRNWGLPCGPVSKEPACNAGNPVLTLGSGRSSGGRSGNPLQYSCLGNPTDRGAWWATVHGVTKSRTWLNNFHSCFPLLWGFPGGSVVKNSPSNAGDRALIPDLERSLGERNGNPLQYSCLGNPTDRAAWWATVHGVAKNRTRLSDFLTQGSNLGLLYCWQILYQLNYREVQLSTGNR